MARTLALKAFRPVSRREGVFHAGFAGKVAAVTGAGSGIGQALAIELA